MRSSKNVRRDINAQEFGSIRILIIIIYPSNIHIQHQLLTHYDCAKVFSVLLFQFSCWGIVLDLHDLSASMSNYVNLQQTTRHCNAHSHKTQLKSDLLKICSTQFSKIEDIRRSLKREISTSSITKHFCISFFFHRVSRKFYVIIPLLVCQ